MKLFPLKIASYVIYVIDAMVWTRKLIGECLGQCLCLIIRWPMERNLYIRCLPISNKKPILAKVFSADDRKLKALEEFIVYKEKCLERL